MYLEDALIHLHKCYRFANAHPLSVTESELDIALHLLAARVFKLNEALRTEHIGIWAEQISRSQYCRHVGTDGGTSGKLVAEYVVASWGHYFGEVANQRWTHSKALVHNGLVTLVQA